MDDQDNISRIEALSIQDFKREIQFVLIHDKHGIGMQYIRILLAEAIQIRNLCDELQKTLEHRMQLDLWNNSAD